MENTNEVPQAQQPELARNLSISDANSSADNFVDYDQSLSRNPSMIISECSEQTPISGTYKPIPKISIAGLCPFDNGEDLFAALDKSSLDLFIARNMNQRGWSDIPLAITTFESPLDANKTANMFTNFCEDKLIAYEELAPKMFFNCNKSEGFENVSIHVKLYFNAGKNPIMEFHCVQGNKELFFNIYYSFRNLILKENNHISLNLPHVMPSEKFEMSKEDNDRAVASLLQWFKNDPLNATKVVSQVAMEKDIVTQEKMCNEVFNLLNTQDDLSVLMAQTLGFIEVIQGFACLLDEDHKTMIVSTLKAKIQASLSAPNIPESVRQRAKRFVDGVK